jgi:hypothetical protein
MKQPKVLVFGLTDSHWLPETGKEFFSGGE